MLWIAILILLASADLRADELAGQRCFSGIKLCIAGRFQAFWEQNGGLAVFGLPLTDVHPELDPETGATHLVQWFERHRFELHPENRPPFDVLLGRVGEEGLWQQGRNWRFLPHGNPSAPHYFPETSQAIAAVFWPFWHSSGIDLGDPGVSDVESLALFGRPLSPAQIETNPDGTRVLVQWFERARLACGAGAAPAQPCPHVQVASLGAEVQIQPPAERTPADPAAHPQFAGIHLEPVAGELHQPVFITHAGDGSGRLFVVEKAGTIKSFPGGQTFLDIRDRVGAAGAEQGLFAVAFHPHFRDNGYLYVSYTNRQGNTVVSRFHMRPDRHSADQASEQRVLFQVQPEATHNGGMLAFGPDGMLYLGLGDGGGANDPLHNAQNPATLLGKMLRLDVNTPAGYAIPPDNPLIHNAAARPEIWALGLRNPWRFSFDRMTGDLYIGDVGQDRYDSVQFQAAGSTGGQNYGWPIVEGQHCLRGGNCRQGGLTPPVATYDHRLGCAIIGGYSYRGARLPMLSGRYIFGDFCTGRIWALTRVAGGRWSMDDLLRAEQPISSFGEDEAGEVYVAGFASGTVFRITATPNE